MYTKSIKMLAIVALVTGALITGCKKEELVQIQAAEAAKTTDDSKNDEAAGTIAYRNEKEKANDNGHNGNNGHGNDNGNNGHGNGTGGNGNGGNGNGNGNGTLTAVNLGAAASYAILSQSGITDVSPSAITGNVGSSPITGAAILLTCSEVTGSIYSVDATGPAPCVITNASGLSTAVGDMQTAYNNAAGRINPDYLNLGSGTIGGVTLSPGLYTWTTPLLISSSIILSGGFNDVWIFQVAGTFDVSSAVNITLAGGAQAKNIFWQVSGAVTLGTYSHLEGTILGKTGINLLTGSSVNGRLLAQTAAVLQISTVVKP